MKLGKMKKQINQEWVVTFLVGLMLLTGCSTVPSQSQESSQSSEKIVQTSESNQEVKTTTTTEQTKKNADNQRQLDLAIKQNYQELANKEYSGTQTIDVNDGNPYFSQDDLSLQKGAWEVYGDLDSLNRATSANALLNQSLMPTTERGDISSVTPTGWKNKKIKNGYLYNRSHLIGWALAGENANVKNLITGTRQLNSPEMLRFEMDVKYYLEQSPDNYVRYRITPIFRDDELLARGVQMEAQSVNSDAIKFNVYIFNIQDGVTLNYADGTNTVTNEVQEEISASQQQEASLEESNQPTQQSAKEYVDANGNGLIKGSKRGIYHIPGSTYYDKTTNPVAWFKTIEEAEAAGYRAPK